MKIVRDSLWSTLHELTASKRPNWERVSGTWVDAWVQSGGSPVEKQVQELGSLIRRHDRDATIRAIDAALRYLDDAAVGEAAA